ncbi:MAG: hypothetical protein ACREKK_00440 [Candidatus Methylomirabilales bacterium]
MRLYGPSGTRADFVDRGPFADAAGDVAGITAGASTIITYIGPANRRTQLTCHLDGLVTTVFVAGQVAQITVQRTVPAPTAVVAQRRFPAAAALGTEKDLGPITVWVEAGQTWQVRGDITAGTGAMDVQKGMSFLEVDA